MSVQVLCDGGGITLQRGDRFEIVADRSTDAQRIVRRDYDGTDASITFDPGAASSVVMRKLGPQETNERPFYLENQLKPLRVIIARNRRIGR